MTSVREPTRQVGELWAYAADPEDRASPFYPVRIIQEGLNQHRVRFTSGDEGAVERWVPTACLICPWDSTLARYAFNQPRFAALVEAHHPLPEDLEFQAAATIVQAYPKRDLLLFQPTWTAVYDLDALCADLSIEERDLAGAPLAFVEFGGLQIVPRSAATLIVSSIIVCYPEAILASVLQEERELRNKTLQWNAAYARQGTTAGRAEPAAWFRRQIRQRRAVLDFVREWCTFPLAQPGPSHQFSSARSRSAAPSA